MKKIIITVGVLCIAVMALALGSAVWTIQKNKADQETLLGLLYQQKAGEYRALCLQAYNMAYMQLKWAKEHQKDGRPLAVVTDLDETALDNSTGDAYAYRSDIGYDPTQWSLTGRPAAVPGAVDFFNYAVQQGFHIYYVSNRNQTPAVVDSTRNRMRELGFPVEAKQNCYFLFLPVDQIGSSKEPRRLKIQDTLKENIVLLLGDNLADISERFDKVNGSYLSSEARQQRVSDSALLWGHKWIVLPNAYYGDWESALYKHYQDSTGKSPSLGRKDTIRELSLKIYNYLPGHE